VAVDIAALFTGRQPQGIGPPPGHACELSSPRVQPSSSPGLHLPNRSPSPTVLPTRQTGGRRGRCHSRGDGPAAACRVKAGVLSCDLQTKPRQSRCLSSTMHLPQVPKTESGARTDRLTSCDTKCCSRIRLLHLETVPSAPTPVRQRPAEPAGGRLAGEMNTCRRASRFDPCLSRTSLPGR
jgi:hypothetical protein